MVKFGGGVVKMALTLIRNITNIKYDTDLVSGDNICISADIEGVVCSIPISDTNKDYQEVLDTIAREGSDCCVGDVPEELQSEVDSRLFSKQVMSYQEAKARIAQHLLSEGKEEVTETQSVYSGRSSFNEETGFDDPVMEDVEVLISPYIPPFEPATVKIIVTDEDFNSSEQTIVNPLITKDLEERAAAQTIIDNTPDAVISHLEDA